MELARGSIRRDMRMSIDERDGVRSLKEDFAGGPILPQGSRTAPIPLLPVARLRLQLVGSRRGFEMGRHG